MVILFHEGEMYQYLESLRQAIKHYIDQSPKNEILNLNEEEYCNCVVSKFKIDSLSIDMNKIQKSDSQEVDVDVRNDRRRDIFDRTKPFNIKCTLVKIHIPYKGNKELIRIQPSTYTTHQVNAEIHSGEIILSYTFSIDTMTNSELESKIDGDIRFINEMVNNQNSQIQPFNNTELPNLVKSLFEKRKKKLAQDQEIVSFLKFPMKRKNEEKIIFRPPRVKRKISPLKPHTHIPELEPELDFTEYEHIIKVVNSMGQSLEQCSKTVREMGEEDLRLLFLIILNSHYENQASGETFNKVGNTDIMIKAREKNIFIAECKIWDGKEYFLDGINQLLKYLSWRDTKTSYIIFCKKKKFTEIIEKAGLYLKEHQNFVNYIKKISDSCFMYKFKHKDDNKKEIFLTLHLFHVPTE